MLGVKGDAGEGHDVCLHVQVGDGTEVGRMTGSRFCFILESALLKGAQSDGIFPASARAFRPARAPSNLLVHPFLPFSSLSAVRAAT